MPTPALKSLAKEAGKSVNKAEEYWNEAKQQAKKAGFKEGTSRFYSYVMGIVKKRLGLSESATMAGKILEQIDSFDKSIEESLIPLNKPLRDVNELISLAESELDFKTVDEFKRCLFSKQSSISKELAIWLETQDDVVCSMLIKQYV
jgi:uncharacterized coiled-coil DUF342 family protein